MNKFTQIVSITLFTICGAFLALGGSKSPPSKGNQMYAAAPYMLPECTISAEMPLDLKLDLMKQQEKALDTVYVTKTDTIEKQVVKVKWRQAPAPEPIVVRDTIYYLATQVGQREGPTEKCISIYEVHKVDEVCPENNNSSTDSTSVGWSH